VNFSTLFHKLLGLLALAVLATGQAHAAPNRVAPRAKIGVSTSPDDGAYRARSGRAELFLPPWFEADGGTYDVVLHFHGMARLQEANVIAAKLNAAVVSVNLGVVSARYGSSFRSPQAFEALLTKTQRLVAASGRAKGAKIGRIALSAWSAGFESVGAILKHDANRGRIDAVFLADGLHAAYTDSKKRLIEERSLAKYARLGEEAMRGEKLFVLTHSSIPTYGYATVSETVGTVLRLTSVEKAAPPSSSPRNMQAIYQVHRGDFHVTGFEGTGVSDHIDHIRAMGETMYPLLAARWGRARKAAEAT
jgi:hypothetical protein